MCLDGAASGGCTGVFGGALGAEPPVCLDRISIVGLRVHGRHGVFDHERASGQDFVVDAVLWLDTAPAAATDDLALTADYGDVAGRLADIVAGEPVALIETLADRLAAACLSRPGGASRPRSPCTSRRRRSASSSPTSP